MTREEALQAIKEKMDYYESDKRLRGAIETLIPELTESEDERINKTLQEYVKNRNWPLNGPTQDEVLAWLERQKENIDKEYVFRPLAGTDINSAVLQAIRRADEGDRLVLAFNGAYIPVRKGSNANKIVDIYDAFIEKQNEVRKAIEAVDRIDKYIDENLANAHDMKDSNPDKKYYRGWDDALGEMARILQDVYSEEKQKDLTTENIYKHSRERMPFYNEQQKEQKDYNKLYEDIGKSEWFKKAYEGKSLGCDYEQKEQKPIEHSDEELQRYQNELYDFKVFATKQAKEHHISHVHDFEWNNFCAGLLSYFNEQKPEWSEEDEEKLERVEDLLWMLDDYLGDDCSICEERTARLRDEIQKELCPWLKSLRPWKPNVEKLYYDRVNKEFYVKETINDPKSAIQELYKRLNKR